MSELSLKHLSLGCEPIDRLLRGGLPAGEVTLLYGEAGTGKSTIALLYAVACARADRKALVIDADGSFSKERLKQLLGSYAENVTSRIGIFTPPTFFEQTILIESLERYLSGNSGLIVIDTINRLYRVSLGNMQYSVSLNKELNRQLAYLTRLCSLHSVAVLITSQVRSVIGAESPGEKVEPVATRTLRFWSDNILRLRTTPNTRERLIFAEKHRGRLTREVFCRLRLVDRGIEPLTH
ncbi:MAG: AAA family ATPase [Candidatus Bathyarchaeia archaeon]